VVKTGAASGNNSRYRATDFREWFSGLANFTIAGCENSG